MTTRIDARFAELKNQGRSAFITFLMAGDPDPRTSLDIIKALPKAGADIIEIGMPSSRDSSMKASSASSSVAERYVTRPTSCSQECSGPMPG